MLTRRYGYVKSAGRPGLPSCRLVPRRRRHRLALRRVLAGVRPHARAVPGPARGTDPRPVVREPPEDRAGDTVLPRARVRLNIIASGLAEVDSHLRQLEALGQAPLSADGRAWLLQRLRRLVGGELGGVRRSAPSAHVRFGCWAVAGLRAPAHAHTCLNAVARGRSRNCTWWPALSRNTATAGESSVIVPCW